MASYTTRIVLHGAEDANYTQLHAEMGKEGFSRTIESNGNTYMLPHAEYNLQGQLDKGAVLDRAKSAARRVRSVTTDKDFSVLVTKSEGRTWHNLERLSQER